MNRAQRVTLRCVVDLRVPAPTILQQIDCSSDILVVGGFSVSWRKAAFRDCKAKRDKRFALWCTLHAHIETTWLKDMARNTKKLIKKKARVKMAFVISLKCLVVSHFSLHVQTTTRWLKAAYSPTWVWSCVVFSTWSHMGFSSLDLTWQGWIPEKEKWTTQLTLRVSAASLTCLRTHGCYTWRKSISWWRLCDK